MERLISTLRYFRAYFPDTDAGQLLWALALVATFCLSVAFFIGVAWLAVKLAWILLWAGVWLLTVCIIGMGPRRRSRTA